MVIVQSLQSMGNEVFPQRSTCETKHLWLHFDYFLVLGVFLRTPEWLMTKSLQIKGYQLLSHEATTYVPCFVLSLMSRTLSKLFLKDFNTHLRNHHNFSLNKTTPRFHTEIPELWATKE